MKYFKQLLVSLAMLSMVFVGACSSGGTSAPDQSDVNFEFQQLIIDLETLVGEVGFFNVNDCASLQAALNAIAGSVICDISGSSTITISNFTCTEGPPLSASFSISEDDEVCEDSDEFSNGILNATVTFDGTNVVFNVSSSGFTAEDLTFTFNGLVVTINSSLISSCSGSGDVNGETCTANSDCSGCTLQ